MLFKYMVLEHDVGTDFSSPNYKTFIIDLDGCLLNRKQEISDKNLKALIHIKKRGVRIIFATGRGRLMVKRICEEVGLKDKHVLCHGASIYNATNDQEYQLNTVLNEDDLNLIIPKLIKENIKWVAFGVKNYYCHKKSEIMDKLIQRKDWERGAIELVEIPKPKEFKWPEMINKILGSVIYFV